MPQVLANWCLNLLQTYSSWQHSEAGTVGGPPRPGDAAGAEAEAERASQLKALLKLLMNLTQSFDCDATSRLAEVCRVTQTGVSVQILWHQ